MKIIDMHCDTILKMYHLKQEKQPVISLRNNNLHISLDKMKAGDYLAQCFALFIPDVVDDPYHMTCQAIDLYEKEIIKNHDLIDFAYCAKDIIANQKVNKMSSILTFEGTCMLEKNLSRLDEFYQKGVRMITLTWNYPNDIAFPNIDMTGLKPKERPEFTAKTSKEYGITDFGKKAVKKMNELGIIIDASHLSDRGFYDLLNLSDKPFVCSHSNSRAITNSVRNITDDMIKKLSAKGGIMGINYCPAFISTKESETAEPIEQTIEDTVKHINHIREVGGIECLAFGSDFDGIGGDLELKDASYLPKLIEALKREGYSEDDLDKMTHQNFLRLFTEVQR